MAPQETRIATDLARQVDETLTKICRAQFGHTLTAAEWKALPFALRRELDKQARQQVYRKAGKH